MFCILYYNIYLMSKKSEIIKVGLLTVLAVFGTIAAFAAVVGEQEGGIVISAHALRDNPTEQGSGYCYCNPGSGVGQP
jgi:hypothetical protein